MAGADETNLAEVMPQVAKALLGRPNPALSNEHEWRYGTRGSLSIDLVKGVFHDHEAGEGGGVLDLIAREVGLRATRHAGGFAMKV
ncbi:MAG: hypothetical protein ACXWVJ_08925 [Caulobacteraceae bacterium]